MALLRHLLFLAPATTGAPPPALRTRLGLANARISRARDVFRLSRRENNRWTVPVARRNGSVRRRHPQENLEALRLHRSRPAQPRGSTRVRSLPYAENAGALPRASRFSIGVSANRSARRRRPQPGTHGSGTGALPEPCRITKMRSRASTPCPCWSIKNIALVNKRVSITTSRSRKIALRDIPSQVRSHS